MMWPDRKCNEANPKKNNWSADNPNFRLIFSLWKDSCCRRLSVDQIFVRSLVHHGCLEWIKKYRKSERISYCVQHSLFLSGELMTKRCSSLKTNSHRDNTDFIRPRNFLKLAAVIGFMIAVALIALYYRNFLIILIIIAVWIS